MNRLLTVASSPHIRSELSTQKIMAWVLLALAPTGIAGIYFLGVRSLQVMAAGVISCVIAEAVWQKLAGLEITVKDLSAAVSGLLLAYNAPPEIPLWMVACGGVFAMIVVKHFFGGLGQNIVNPALAGRAFMLTCWPVAMTTWTVHGVSGPTPLAIIKGAESTGAVLPGIPDLFVGNIGGCIGETSTFALLAGFCILMSKDIIDWKTPVVYIATTAVLSVLFGRSGGPLVEILSGGLFLGAIFMATDYATTPMTEKGQIIFAAGCGFFASLIRAFGGYPEGVSYSILIMNLTVPLIDRFTVPRILGEAKKHGGK